LRSGLYKSVLARIFLPSRFQVEDELSLSPVDKWADRSTQQVLGNIFTVFCEFPTETVEKMVAVGKVLV
jgi:hypothetical protein